MFNILGFHGGIGSPAILSCMKGHNLIGNIEPRPFAHVYDKYGRNTFSENFPNSWLVRKINELPKIELERIKKVDVILGHPKCGSYSALINKSGQDRINSHLKKSQDFIEFINIVNQLKPKFAFFDNLPKSLLANPPELYYNSLPKYDVSIQYVSNYNYGNSQSNRNRLFIIASLKDLEYTFIPGEKPNYITAMNAIKDIPEGTFNHDKHNTHLPANVGRRVFQDSSMTWGQVQKVFKEKSNNKPLFYINKNGEKKYHFGFRKISLDKPSPTLIGTNPVIHPHTCLPTSIRERARIQGFPDSFNFYGTKFESDGTWAHNRNSSMIKQTGRCIPCEFPKFLIDQFYAHITNDKDYKCTGNRQISMPKYMEEILYFSDNE